MKTKTKKKYGGHEITQTAESLIQSANDESTHIVSNVTDGDGVNWRLQDDYIDITINQNTQAVNLVQNSIMYIDKDNLYLDTNSTSEIIKRTFTRLIKGGNIIHLKVQKRDEADPTTDSHIYIAPPKLLGNIVLVTLPALHNMMLSQNYYVGCSKYIETSLFGGTGLLKQFMLNTGTSYFKMKNTTPDKNGVIAIASTGNVIQLNIESNKKYRINNDMLIGWVGDLQLNSVFNPVGKKSNNNLKKTMKSAFSGVGMMTDVTGEGYIFLESRRNPFKTMISSSSKSNYNSNNNSITSLSSALL